jgi:hypothetical protein
MAVKGLFKSKHIILTKHNCLIHKPLCEKCKKNKTWKIATKVISIQNKLYSLCNECYSEESYKEDSDNVYSNKKETLVKMVEQACGECSHQECIDCIFRYYKFKYEIYVKLRDLKGHEHECEKEMDS